MFLLGGLFAVLVRTTLLWHSNSAVTEPLITAELYNRFFTFHGAIMVFIVIIPGIPAAMGNFVLPMMLGAKDVCIPARESAQLLHVAHRYAHDPHVAFLWWR